MGKDNDIFEGTNQGKDRPSRRPCQERAEAAFASFVVAVALMLQGIVVAAIYLLFFPLYVILIFETLLFSVVKEMAGRLLSSPVEEGVERVARDTDEPGSRTNHCKTAGAYSLAIALVVVTSPILLLLAIAISIVRTSEVIFHAATAPFKTAKSCYNACMKEFQQGEVDGVVSSCIRECILDALSEQLRQATRCEQKVLALFNKHFSPESDLENTNVSVGRGIFIEP